MSLPKKSRSRLSVVSPIKFGETPSSLTKNLHTISQNILLFFTDTQGFWSSFNGPWLHNYRQRLPQLVVAIGLSLILVRMLNYFPPRTLAHILFPNSYLPLMSLWFLSWWYLGSFLFQGSRRGLLLAVITSSWIYSRLLLIISPWWWWLLIGVSWLVLEIVAAKIKAHRI